MGHSKQSLLSFASYTQSIVSSQSLENGVSCFHVYTRYCQTNRPQHILKCGQIFMNHALILNRTIFLSTLSKQQSTVSIQSGHNPSERVLFHLSQSVFRKLQSLGLQSEYHNDPEFALTMRMKPALAFVPPELVSWSFQLVMISNN